MTCLAIASLLAVACTAETEPSATEAPLPSVVASASVAPEPSATVVPTASEAAPAGWSQVAAFGDGGGWDTARTVVRGAESFLAVGTRLEPAGDVGFARIADHLWWSADGTSWEEVALGPEFEAATVRDVISTPDGGYVAFGSRDAEDEFVSAVWESPDGVTWTEVATDLDSNLLIGKVVAGAQGYLLLGEQSTFTDASLWLSSDGLAWQEVHHFSQDEFFVQVDDIGAGEEGFVAFGVQISTTEPATWERFAFASGDGSEWVQAVQPFGAEAPDYQPWPAVAPLGPNWVAAIAQQDDSAAIWFSPDGLAWSSAATIEGLSTSEAWSPVMVSTGARLFFSPAGEVPTGRPGVWTSTNAREWEVADLGVGAVVGGAVGAPPESVLAGTTFSGSEESQATFWIGPAD
jgi:hypothetical protein